jgi:hypothetical protein
MWCESSTKLRAGEAISVELPPEHLEVLRD